MKNNTLYHLEADTHTRYSLGICVGASTVSIVHLAQPSPPRRSAGGNIPDRPRIVASAQYPHDGDPKQTLLKALASLDMTAFTRIAATGRRFRQILNLSTIPEPDAVELAYAHIKPADTTCPAIVSAGGETFMVYLLNRQGRITGVQTGNKCASGTGEFFLQQLRRMDVTLDEAATWSSTEAPHRVSGRCSVFCKSDCTHATNQGVPREKVTAGLCRMMANKVLELLKKVDRRDIMVTGGTAQNQMMIAYLKQEIPGLIVPEEAPCFEALGAALWALENDTRDFPGQDQLFLNEQATFDTLSPLVDFESDVKFKTISRATVAPGDQCILGLDVGSTTTKAVLLRTRDNAILATIYLRTNGDPVGASRRCYQAILDEVKKKVDPAEIHITGLGVCGSGRQIAGLHALTDGVINEIIAHAAAAIYFDPKVDTIFEIGGQDAKYTYITNGVASDYAMNEACSAGTGSFLEESALETLGIQMEDIADVALKGKHPPNFNDQCAAFIESDIKNAIHEGIAHDDIVAGLVYSICMNYANRVKGNRPMGGKVFMQGGVCYNRAVPMAMASLLGKPIIVPPEPGLMGAFGVALEVKKRLKVGLMAPQRFDLNTLIERRVEYGKSFICGGGKEKCDRRCEIAMIRMDGEKYPFGGACNRYYNLRRNVRFDIAKLDLVRIRQQLIFEKYGVPAVTAVGRRPTVGLNRSFLVNTYYPLYSTFFSELGFDLIIPDHHDQEGIDRRNAPFCYPVELAHGFFHALITGDTVPDYLFLPHFKAVPVQNGNANAQLCPLVQGETFYLQTTFKRELDGLSARGTKVLAPLLDLTAGLATSEKILVKTARDMGIGKRDARRAFNKAIRQQQQCHDEMKAIGRQALAELAEDPDKVGVVVLGRPYNAFSKEAHMGIPHKFASRGIMVIPLDFIDYEEESGRRHMYWGMGQMILMAGKVVKRHPQLFGTYITNFSCGPDSFVIGYFRSLMGRKPSLTLELDSHTADAGLETRIEAFLDIVTAYRKLESRGDFTVRPRSYTPARATLENGEPYVITSDGKHLPLTDPRVTLLVPSMGRLSSESIVPVFNRLGYNAKVHDPSDEAVLKLGRANTTCKECLPLILTTGTLLSYIQNEKKEDEVLVYFMPTGSGPCRFGQYYIFMEDLISRLEIPDVAMLSLSAENSYLGMADDFNKWGWFAVIVSDMMEDIRAMLMANAKQPDAAMDLFEQEWGHIRNSLARDDFSRFEKQLAETSLKFRNVALKRPVEEVPIIALTGEIFVRRDGLSRQHITEHLARQGFATVCAPIAEWVRYTDYCAENGLSEHDLKGMERLRFFVRQKFMVKYEKQIKEIVNQSGLIHAEVIDIPGVISKSAPYISHDLAGEAVLTIGSSLDEVATKACGVIAIGPFGCMPNRLSESILNEVMTRTGKLAASPGDEDLKMILTDLDDLPFLAIESDGSPFPQLINAKLETFCLQARRLHERMREVRAAR
ncbi:MAG: activase [Deltaproteobacteria bacterium]|nr:MAG: activase [Deltaproteobacteria bacterium]